MAGSAAQSFNPDTTASGEAIKKTSSLESSLKQIEKGLLETIRSGTCGLSLSGFQKPALESPSNDANHGNWPLKELSIVDFVNQSPDPLHLCRYEPFGVFVTPAIRRSPWHEALSSLPP